MELGTFRQLKSQFRCGIQLDISWLALDKLSNFNGVQYGLFAVINVLCLLGKAPVIVSLLCHTWDTKCSLRPRCFRSTFSVVDVLTMVLVLLGPRAREGMYNEGGRY